MLRGDVEHPCDVAKHRVGFVRILVTLNCNEAIGLMDDKVDPRKLFCSFAAEVDN
jgi:hypothetical protein